MTSEESVVHTSIVAGWLSCIASHYHSISLLARTKRCVIRYDDARPFRYSWLAKQTPNICIASYTAAVVSIFETIPTDCNYKTARVNKCVGTDEVCRTKGVQYSEGRGGNRVSERGKLRFSSSSPAAIQHQFMYETHCPDSPAVTLETSERTVAGFDSDKHLSGFRHCCENQGNNLF